MKKITAYEIHLSVSAQGQPVSGFVNYKLPGDANFSSTSTLTPADLAVFASILINDNVYYDDNSGQFIRTS
jgi:hypothetical protein